MIYFDVAEAVIFERESHDFDVAIVQIKVVAAILWHVRSDGDWVLVGAKNEEVPLNLAAELRHICFVLIRVQELLLLMLLSSFVFILLLKLILVRLASHMCSACLLCRI